MPISHDYKVIFVHIPKAAGTSIEYAFGMHGRTKTVGLKPQRFQRKDIHRLFGQNLQHMTVDSIRQTLERMHFRDYSRLMVVKSFADRILEAFGIAPGQAEVDYHRGIFESYHKFSVVRNPFDRFLSHFFWKASMWKETSPTRSDFIEYAKHVRDKKLYLNDLENGGHLTPQADFLTIDGQLAIDSLLHFERLADDFSQLCEKLELQLELPHRMKSAKKNRDQYYTEREFAFIADVYAEDFDTFGYSRQP